MKKTAEEILEEIQRIERVSAYMDDSYVLKRVALKAMVKYASQSLPPVSEEEIKEISDKYATDDDGWHDGFIAEYFRDGFKAALFRLPQREVVGKTDKLEVEQPEEKKEETYPREFVIWLFFDSKITYHGDLITDKNGKIYLNLFEVFKYWESKHHK